MISRTNETSKKRNMYSYTLNATKPIYGLIRFISYAQIFMKNDRKEKQFYRKETEIRVFIIFYFFYRYRVYAALLCIRFRRKFNHFNF